MLHTLRALTALTLVGAVAAGEEPAYSPPPINYDAAYADGVNAYVAHRYGLAEESLESAITARNDPAAWMFKGLAERALGKHAEAQESIHMASSLLASGTGSTVSLDRALERIQGPFRLYLDDVERYYVRTNLTPGQVISGAAEPVVPVAPDRVAPEAAPPAAPVPLSPESPAPPPPELQNPQGAPTTPPPPPPAPASATPAPQGELIQVTARKPVAVAENAPGVPAVVTGAPVYPLPGAVYGEQVTSAGSTDLVPPVPVGPCCSGVGTWLPIGFAYPYPVHYDSVYGWWDRFAFPSPGW
jgi:hypothetical protein